MQACRTAMSAGAASPLASMVNWMQMNIALPDVRETESLRVEVAGPMKSTTRGWVRQTVLNQCLGLEAYQPEMF